jgi:DNA-binding MarR family transcriptional regulator
LGNRAALVMGAINLVLSRIGTELTITDFARALSTGKSTAVGMADRLERAGLVERRRGRDLRKTVQTPP